MLPSTHVTSPAGSDTPGEAPPPADPAGAPGEAATLAGGLVPPPPQAARTRVAASAATTIGPRDVAMCANTPHAPRDRDGGRPPAGGTTRRPAPLASSS